MRVVWGCESVIVQVFGWLQEFILKLVLDKRSSRGGGGIHRDPSAEGLKNCAVCPWRESEVSPQVSPETQENPEGKFPGHCCGPNLDCGGRGG